MSGDADNQIPAIVYMATNTITGSFYIGVTKKALEVRRREHLSAAANRPDLYRPFLLAIRKYGADAFDWEILERHADYRQALLAEVRLIQERRPKYNASKGGEGGTIAMIFAHPGRMSPERIAAWIDRRTAAIRAKKRTAEQRQRIRAASRPDVHFKPVICLDTGAIYPSIKHAAEATGAPRGQIGSVCRGDWATAGGLHFAFSDRAMSDQERQTLIITARARITRGKDAIVSSRSKAVICVQTGVRYPSASAASREHGLSPLRVSQICRGEGVTNGGLSFYYEGAGPQPSKRKTAAEIKEILRNNGRKAKPLTKSVVLPDDGRRFTTISECAKALGVSISAVSTACQRRGTTGGFRVLFEGTV